MLIPLVPFYFSLFLNFKRFLYSISLIISFLSFGLNSLNPLANATSLSNVICFSAVNSSRLILYNFVKLINSCKSIFLSPFSILIIASLPKFKILALVLVLTPNNFSIFAAFHQFFYNQNYSYNHPNL